MDFINSHVLSFVTFFPLVTALVLLAMPSLALARWVAMGGAIVTFLGTLHVWYYFDLKSAGLQFTEAYEWIPTFGIKYIMGVDGLSILLVMLTTILVPLILLSQWHIEEKKQKGFLALFLGLETGMLGSLFAFDLVFFYMFWEAMLIPMYFIIGIWGGANRIYATTKFIIYTVAGSLFMLMAAIVLYIIHHQETGTYTTSLLDLYQTHAPYRTQLWLFAAFAVAFAIKVPLFPFHTWLPDAHTEAPTSGSVILAGVLLKLGTYGFLRFAIPLFPDAVATFAPVLVTLGIVGIVYGALNAWMQKDAKKMVAYSSVSHLGFVVIGCVAMMVNGTELSVEALTGAVYQMINHGVSTGALFFLVGVIYERRHTRLLADFGGLAKAMPWFATLLIIATLSSVGLPGTGGFTGEFLILLGTYQSSPIAAGFASLGVLLGAIYMLTLCRKILYGPLDNPANQVLEDLNLREFGYLIPLAVLAIVMGVFPNFFLERSRASIENLAKNYRNYHLVATSGALAHDADHVAKASDERNFPTVKLSEVQP